MSHRDVMQALRDAGVEPTRNAAIDAMWGAELPEPWTVENEMQLPPELRDFSWLDKEVETRAHPGAVGEEEGDPPEMPG
jgi:hypothetical protein